MNMRALKKEWKKYRKDCKRNKVEFLSLDEFVEKVLSEQNDTMKDSKIDENESEGKTDSNSSSLENEVEGKADSNSSSLENEDDFIEIPDIVPVKLVTRCTCKETCPCHETDETCSCEEECDCVKETINENMPHKKGTHLTYEQSENYEEYLESLPSDVKYSELEPDLWKTIIHTDTFKKAECYDIKTAEKNTQEVLATYKELFQKTKNKNLTKKKTKKSTKKSKAKSKTKVSIEKTEMTKTKTTSKPAKKSIAKKAEVIKPAKKAGTTKTKTASKAANKSSSKKKTTKK